MKPIISQYYSHTHIHTHTHTHTHLDLHRSAESTRAWSRSRVFSECPCFHRSVNLDQCQTVSTFFVKDILHIETCKHVFPS